MRRAADAKLAILVNMRRSKPHKDSCSDPCNGKTHTTTGYTKNKGPNLLHTMAFAIFLRITERRLEGEATS